VYYVYYQIERAKPGFKYSFFGTPTFVVLVWFGLMVLTVAGCLALHPGLEAVTGAKSRANGWQDMVAIARYYSGC
jgi:hypothetical protein